jgi:hypothetical protein
MRLINILASTVLALLLVASPAAAQDTAEAPAATAQDTDDAVEAAGTWLALVDAEEFQASWEASGDMLKEQVTSAQWFEALSGVQMQLASYAGSTVDLSQRAVVMAQRLEDIPQLPEGEYVMVRYRTTQDDNDFVEVVTLRQDPDAWRVVGYFVAPEEEQ